MNTQDQWFEPGMKVCRVAYADEIGLDVNVPALEPSTDKGSVLCVERCWNARGINWVTFVGVPCPPDEAWYACCFRRIEEIQLCVRAAEKFKQNEEVEI